MTNTETRSTRLQPQSSRPQFALKANRLVQLGLYAVVFITAINMPWVRRFVINAASDDPLVGIGYWVLGALFSLVLVWTILRNIARDRKGIRIGVEIALVLFWAVWISWLTNDRMNASDAFDRLGVVVNVVLVGLFAFALALPVVWYDTVRRETSNRWNNFRARRS